MPAAEQVTTEQLQPMFGEKLFNGLKIQRKLQIGAPDDPLELEADAMADKVMRMPDQNFIQRKCDQCKDDEKVQAKPLESFIQRKCAHCDEKEEGEHIQRKSFSSFIQRKDTSAGAVASESISNQINSSRGNGSVMDTDTRSFMESRFGSDFGNVKIHTNKEALQMNRELEAKAFTVGKDIYFNEGQYQPNSDDGRRLLAHELTHVVQQNSKSHIYRKRIKVSSESTKIDPQSEKAFSLLSDIVVPTKSPDKGKFVAAELVSVTSDTFSKTDKYGKDVISTETFYILAEHTADVETGSRWTLVVDRKITFEIAEGGTGRIGFRDVALLKKAPGSAKLSSLINSGAFELHTWQDWDDTIQVHIDKPHYRSVSLPVKFGAKDTLSHYVGKNVLTSFTSSTKDRIIELRRIFGLKPPETPKPHIVPKPQPSGPEVPVIKDDEETTTEITIHKPEPPKPKKRSFLDDLFDAISDFFGAIADFISKIWNALPSQVRGILKTVGKFIAGVAAAAAVAAVVVFLFPEIAFGTAMLAIGAFLFGFSFGSSLMHRYNEAKANGKVNYGDIFGVSVLDAFGISGVIEAFTDKSMLTGKELKRSIEDRWEAGSTGLLTFFTSIFGIRQFKGSPKGKMPVAPEPPVKSSPGKSPTTEPVPTEPVPDPVPEPAPTKPAPTEPPLKDPNLDDSGKRSVAEPQTGKTPGKSVEEDALEAELGKKPAPEEDVSPKKPAETPAKPAKLTRHQVLREAAKKKLEALDIKKTKNQAKLDTLDSQIYEANKELGRLKGEIDNLPRGTDQRAKALERFKQLKEHLEEIKDERQGYYEERQRLTRAEEAALEPLGLKRPALRTAPKKTIREAAKKNDKGEFLDANTGEVIKGDPVYGHKWGREHRRLVLEASEKGMTQEQFNDWVNDHPEWFQLETKANNESHRFEKPGVD